MNKILAFTAGLILVLSSCSDKKPEQLPDNFKENRDKFISAIETFQESNKISSELPNYTADEQSSQEQKMKTLVHKGIETSNEISDDFLNYLHPDLSDNFRNKLVKSNELYLDGLSLNLMSRQSHFRNNFKPINFFRNGVLSGKIHFDQIDKNLSAKTKKTFGQN